jgi:hypothetical protein
MKDELAGRRIPRTVSGAIHAFQTDVTEHTGPLREIKIVF